MRFPPVLLFALVGGTGVSAEAAAQATGQAGDWTVVDAIAVHDAVGIELVVSDKPFDRAGIAGDLRFDIRDSSAHEDIAQGRMLRLHIDAEGMLSSLAVGGSSSCTSDMENALALRQHSADAIAGRFEYDTIKLEFELPLWTNGAIPRVGAAGICDGSTP